MTRDELDLQAAIARRAEKLGADYLTTLMDLQYCNAVCPLDFERLLTFAPFDFAHDILGIAEHFDRRALTLGGCFIPRCAKPEAYT